MSKTKKTTTTKASAKPAKATKAQRTAAVAQAQATDAAANAHATPAPRRMAEVAAEAEQAAKETKTAKTKKAPAEKKPKKVSGLDAAFEVLKAKGEPMACKDIVETMLTKGMWKTSGKTPAATIYSAMLREIDGKPGESRFAKTGRGLFAIATPKKA